MWKERGCMYRNQSWWELVSERAAVMTRGRKREDS